MSLKRKRVHQSKIVWASAVQILAAALLADPDTGVVITVLALLIVVFRIRYTDTKIGDQPELK